MNQLEFKKWLTKKHPELKKVTIVTTASDASYIFNHDMGITFDDIINGRKNLSDYKEAVRMYLITNGKKPGTRPSGYASHLKYLIEYAKELGLVSFEFEPMSLKSLKNVNIRKPRVIESKSISVSRFDIEEAFNKVKNDPVYGEESRYVEIILNRFPCHDSLEEIVCKICVIDVTHSTHVGIHKKHFSVVDLAEKIKSIPNIDKRLESGDLSLINEIANAKGVNLLSFASKYCTCHNQMIYQNDDFYKYDSIVSKAIGYKGRSYQEYFSRLDEIIASNNLNDVMGIRRKLDYYFWYNNR